MANWKGKQGEGLGCKPYFMTRRIAWKHADCPPESGGQRDREADPARGGSKAIALQVSGIGTTPALRATPPNLGGEFAPPSIHPDFFLNRVFLLFFFLLLAGCANSEYRFERMDGDKAVSIPMKLDSLDGARDGESVTAEARFSNGNDSAQMSVRLFLRPPAEFVSGTYRVTIDGKTVEGIVECQSLDYQGGQGSVPSMGGKFVLKPGYRIIIPSTPIKRR
jgi:hypothetical protein